MYKKIGNFTAVATFVLTGSVTLGTAIFSPANAQPAGCGSGWSYTALRYVLSPISSRQFNVACVEHDQCYDTLGKSQQECDKAFHNRMLGICARDHNTIIGKPLKARCNGFADIYYSAVQKNGGEPHSQAQKAAAQKASAPHCVFVNSRTAWQRFNLPRAFTKVTSISGGWSVDAKNYAPVGASGHTGRDAELLAPYNQYKFDQRFPFGVLLMSSGQGIVWVQSPNSFSSASFNAVDMRINDADNALGDNGGSLQVCFSN